MTDEPEECEYVITEPVQLPDGELTFKLIDTPEDVEAFIERWRQHYQAITQSMAIPPRILSDD